MAKTVTALFMCGPVREVNISRVVNQAQDLIITLDLLRTRLDELDINDLEARSIASAATSDAEALCDQTRNWVFECEGCCRECKKNGAPQDGQCEKPAANC